MTPLEFIALHGATPNMDSLAARLGSDLPAPVDPDPGMVELYEAVQAAATPKDPE